jgi:putative transposase
VRFVFVEAESALYPVGLLCLLLEVSRSGYYAWRGRPVSRRAVADRALTAEIRVIHERSQRRYGSPRVHEELGANDVRVGRKRVARLMKEDGISARTKRRFVETTDSKHDSRSHRICWSGTSPRTLRTRSGSVTSRISTRTRAGCTSRSSSTCDLYSRRVVGWAMSEHIDTALVMSALNMAVTQRKPARGLMHHTDRGSQYASQTTAGRCATSAPSAA